MTRHQFLTLFFLALLIFIFYQVILIFSAFLHPVFWAAILAYAFYPAYQPLKNVLKFRHSETWAPLLMTLLLLLLVVPPLVFLLINLVGQAIEVYQYATWYIREGRLENLIDQIRAFPAIRTLETGVLQWEPLKQDAADWLLNSSKNLANFAIMQAGAITKNILAWIVNIALVFCFVFIFLKDGRKIYDFIYQATPLEEESKHSLFNQITETFSAVIRGQLLTCVAQAVVAGIIYWALGLPAPIFLAIATFFAALIPFVGTVAIWLPIAVYLLATQAYLKGVLMILLGVFGISLIDNIVKPAIIGERTKLPYFLLFFGILGGLNLYGLMGVFLGPVVLSVFFVLVKIYQEKFV